MIIIVESLTTITVVEAFTPSILDSLYNIQSIKV